VLKARNRVKDDRHPHPDAGQTHPPRAHRQE